MKNYIFVLLENFSLLAFSSAIEPLRLANHISKDKKLQLMLFYTLDKIVLNFYIEKTIKNENYPKIPNYNINTFIFIIIFEYKANPA